MTGGSIPIVIPAKIAWIFLAVIMMLSVAAIVGDSCALNGIAPGLIFAAGGVVAVGRPPCY
jgi:hypothetical protein